MNNVLILMATFNGEKYIDDQLTSISKQTYASWDLIISDDGSSDTTLEKIYNFINSNNDHNIIILKNSEKHGAFNNFWNLLNHAKKIRKYDYYFFCDQDDIWYEDKIEKMVNACLKHKNKPAMIYSNMKIINQNNSVINEDVNAIMGIDRPKYTIFFSQAFIWGCATMINWSLFNTVTPLIPGKMAGMISHDNYYAKYAIAIGTLEFLDEKLIGYRRHESNVTFNNKLKLNITDICKKAWRIDELAKTYANQCIQTLCLIREMKKKCVRFKYMNEIESAITQGGISCVLTMLKLKVFRKQISRTVGLYFIFFTAFYKKYLVIKEF